MQTERLIDGNAYIEYVGHIIDARVAMEHLKVSADNAAELHTALSELYLAGQLTENAYILWMENRKRAAKILEEIHMFHNMWCIVTKGYSLN